MTDPHHADRAAADDNGLETPLPSSLRLERHDLVAVLTLDRHYKRNALDDATVLGLEAFFTNPPQWARAVVLQGDGEHFSAGLDLSELKQRNHLESLQHSRMWHRAFAAIELGRLPVVAVLTGAVIGGGLELAAATHVRVAEPSAFFALPEGQRGLFVGGGGAVRLPRLIGASRMADMMLTGRVYRGQDAECLGFAQYVAAEGEGLATALGLAESMARVSPITTMAVIQALPRIANADRDTGFFMEALMASAASSSPEAQRLMMEFLDGRGEKVRR